MDYSLTDHDIKHALGSDVTKVIAYEDLQNIPALDNFFTDYRFLVILYNWGGSYGHWTCLFRYPHAYTVEFFDPYGVKPDHELFEFSKPIRNKNGMAFPWLTKLLIEWDGNVEYNNYKLQKEKKGIATCGRWVVYRCLNWNKGINAFAKPFMNSGQDRDKQIVELTAPILMQKVNEHGT